MRTNGSSLRRPELSDFSPCVPAANDLNRSLTRAEGRWMARISNAFNSNSLMPEAAAALPVPLRVLQGSIPEIFRQDHLVSDPARVVSRRKFSIISKRNAPCTEKRLEYRGTSCGIGKRKSGMWLKGWRKQIFGSGVIERPSITMKSTWLFCSSRFKQSCSRRAVKTESGSYRLPVRRSVLRVPHHDPERSSA